MAVTMETSHALQGMSGGTYSPFGHKCTTFLSLRALYHLAFEFPDEAYEQLLETQQHCFERTDRAAKA